MQYNLSAIGILKNATPIMFGAFVSFVVIFVDTSFLGQVYDLDPDGSMQSAAGMSGLFYAALFMFFQGFSTGLQIILSRFYGQNKKYKITVYFFTGLLFSVLSAILFNVLQNIFLDSFLDFVIESDTIREEMNSFLGIRLWGFMFYFPIQIFSALFVAMEQTKVLILSTLIIALTNIGLDWLFIFGVEGVMTPLLLEGAAYASLIAEGVGFIFLLIFLMQKHRYLQWRQFYKYFNIKSWLKTVKLSFPLMMQGLFALGAWNIFFFMVDRVGNGAISSNVSVLIRNFYLLAIIPEIGLGSCAKSYVAALFAAKRHSEILPLLHKIAFISITLTALIIHGIWFYPEWILGLLSKNEVIINTTIPIIQMVSGAMLILSVASIYFSYISATTDSWSSLLIETISIAIYLGGTFLSIFYLEPDIFDIWIMDYVYFGSMSILATLYIIYIRPKKIRLYEQKRF